MALTGKVLCALVPLLITVEMTRTMVEDDDVARDFATAFWPAGRRVLDGLSPFDTSAAATQAGHSFPYSALDALVFAGFALLPNDVSGWIFTALNVLALACALWVVKVRDWRVYSIVFAWMPVASAWQSANVTLPLALGIAVMWRYRDRAWLVGALFGLMVTVKLVVWPLGIWLLATRRWKAAAWSLGSAAVVNVASWAFVGFHEISSYREVLDKVSAYEEPRSYSIVGAALESGASRGAAYAVSLVAGAAVGMLCVRRGWRGDDRAALALSVGVGLAATPVVWPHYYSLLAVTLALAAPRLTWAWLVPIALWTCPVLDPGLECLAVGLAVSVALIALSCRAPADQREGESRCTTSIRLERNSRCA